MAWLYKIKEHTLLNAAGDVVSTDGWAGHGAGKNNPDMENVKNVGPLPEGWYTIGEPVESAHTGPYTLPLTPDLTNKEFGRGDFKCHGAAFEHPEMSSDGCMIQERNIRENIHNSGDNRLQVVA